MVKVKKSMQVIKHFVLILTLIVLGSNSYAQLAIAKIEGKQININETSGSVGFLTAFTMPYKNRIDKEMDDVLATCPETLDKSKGNLYQSNIGDLIADLTLSKTIPVFKKRENIDIDICILNHGGIRSILPAGEVTTRTAFQIMPFENTTVVVALKGEQILEFIDYFIVGKKPHPTSGITFEIDANNKPLNIKVKDVPFDVQKTYYVVTSEYLSSGGDSMNFFKKGTKIYDLDYKLRNILLDYFKDVDVIPIAKKIKISQEIAK
jgi:2',3'-cyclic-nucleotide 2'-phosphodiesterase (5'-nucleotidase family)